MRPGTLAQAGPIPVPHPAVTPARPVHFGRPCGTFAGPFAHRARRRRRGSLGGQRGRGRKPEGEERERQGVAQHGRLRLWPRDGASPCLTNAMPGR